MKGFLLKLKNDFIEDVRVRDKTIKNILIICSILTLSVLISFWVKSFAVITCVLACISMFLIKGVKKIYVLIYLLPFYHVIKNSPNSFVLLSIALICAILIIALEFIVDLIKKRKQINWTVSGLFALISVYILIPFGPFNLMYTLKLLSTLAILYLVYVNKDELDFKTLVCILTIGFLIACCFAPLRYTSVRLESFLPDFPAYIGKQKRFSGLTSDPNYFAVEVLLLLSCLTQLYFTNQIKVVYYPLMVILMIVGFLSISKAYLLTLSVFAIVVIVFLCIKKLKYKEKVWIDIVSLLTISLISILICLPEILAVFNRFIGESYVDFGQDQCGRALNTFTTGRSEIWILYIKEICSSPKNILFGHGLGAALLQTNYGETAAHNFYLECLYHLGILGSVIMLLPIIYLLVKTSKKTNRKLINFIPFIVIAFVLLSLNSLVSYRPYILVIVLSYSINFRVKNVENIKGEKNAKSINNNECV